MSIEFYPTGRTDKSRRQIEMVSVRQIWARRLACAAWAILVPALVLCLLAEFNWFGSMALFQAQRPVAAFLLVAYLPGTVLAWAAGLLGSRWGWFALAAFVVLFRSFAQLFVAR